MLPQGIFSVAVSTVLFPTLARFAARGELDDLRATMANGMRQIVLLLMPGGRGDPGALRADDPARLRARRVRRRADRARRRGAVLVRLLAAVQRPLPAAHADLLQPPAALGADRDRGREPGDHGAVLALLFYEPVRGRRDRRRDRDRDRRQRRRPGARPAPRARPARARPARLDDGPGRARRGGAGRRELRRLARCSTRRSAAASAARSPRSGIALGVGAPSTRRAITLLRIPEAAQIWRLLRRRGD